MVFDSLPSSNRETYPNDADVIGEAGRPYLDSLANILLMLHLEISYTTNTYYRVRGIVLILY